MTLLTAQTHDWCSMDQDEIDESIEKKKEEKLKALEEK